MVSHMRTFVDKAVESHIPVIFNFLMITSFLTFAPPSLLRRTGLDWLHYRYATLISIAFLCCASALVWEAGSRIYQSAKARKTKAQEKDKLRREIRTLTGKEFEIVDILRQAPTGTLWLPVEDSAVFSLHSKGIIEFAVNGVMLREERIHDIKPSILCTLSLLSLEILKEGNSSEQAD